MTADRAKLGRRSARFARTLATCGFLLLPVGCQEPPGPPPLGLESAPTQRFQLQAEEKVEVDGTPVEILRFAEFELRTAPLPPEQVGEALDVTHLELFLLRYYQSVEGAPGGPTEIKIDQNGLASSTAARGTQRLELDDTLPYSGKVRDLFRYPVSSVGLDSRGRVVVPLWHTEHPILTGVHLLDWWLLAVPTRPDEPRLAWEGRRPVPQIGQYVLGAELPLRFEQPSGIGGRIASSGSLRRQGMRIAEGFSGNLELDHVGEADFDATGRLVEARLQLRMDFRSDDGGRVESKHQLELTCTSCAPDAESGDGDAAPPS